MLMVHVSGTFAIPDPTVDANPRWRTGTRVFRLTSSSTDDINSDVQTAGEADYQQEVSLETVQETIVSTREPRIVRESTTETRTLQEHQQKQHRHSWLVGSSCSNILN